MSPGIKTLMETSLAHFPTYKPHQHKYQMKATETISAVSKCTQKNLEGYV